MSRQSRTTRRNELVRALAGDVPTHLLASDLLLGASRSSGAPVTIDLSLGQPPQGFLSSYDFMSQPFVVGPPIVLPPSSHFLLPNPSSNSSPRGWDSVVSSLLQQAASAATFGGIPLSSTQQLPVRMAHERAVHPENPPGSSRERPPPQRSTNGASGIVRNAEPQRPSRSATSEISPRGGRVGLTNVQTVFLGSGLEEQRMKRCMSRSNRMWDEMFERLLQYRREHGDCLVPTHYKANPKLGRWVTNQRHRREPLSRERKMKLDQIGFVWRVKLQEPWDTMFERLKAYKRKHGDCLVPQKYKLDPRLGEWVQTQRRERTRSTGKAFAAQRRQKLDAIGFEWCPHQIVWERMFALLKEYKEIHGDCMVPRHWEQDQKLGRWVDQQRVRHKKGGLDPNRKKQLESLGFQWSKT